MSRATFRAFRHGGSIATSRGSRVAYTLSEPGTARFNVERAVRERNCRRRCTRYIRMRGSFIRPSQGGRNSFRFSGRLRGRRLRTGSYRLAMAVSDAARNRSPTKRAHFRIVVR